MQLHKFRHGADEDCRTQPSPATGKQLSSLHLALLVIHITSPLGGDCSNDGGSDDVDDSAVGDDDDDYDDDDDDDHEEEEEEEEAELALG